MDGVFYLLEEANCPLSQPACSLLTASLGRQSSAEQASSTGIGRSKGPEPAWRVAAPGWSRRGAARPWRPGRGPGTAKERRSRGARRSPCGGHSPAAEAAYWQDQLQGAGDGVGRWRLWRLAGAPTSVPSSSGGAWVVELKLGKSKIFMRKRGAWGGRRAAAAAPEQEAAAARERGSRGAAAAGSSAAAAGERGSDGGGEQRSWGFCRRRTTRSAGLVGRN